MSTTANPAARPKSRLTPLRALVIGHRWVGILLCLFFAMWFASGAVMMFVPYPFLGDGARIAHIEPLRTEQIVVAPGAVPAEAGISNPSRIRLLEVAGRALYVVNPPKGPQVIVSATTGKRVDGVTADQAKLVGEHFAQTPVANVSEPFDYDQWVVHHRFDRYRPVYRVDLADGAGTQLYVSQRSGEVIQRSTHFERAWNYAGAVIHWIYPTILRKSWVTWDRTVWWLSLVGVAVTIAGIWLGIVRWRNQVKSGRGGMSPYRGWMKWHHIGGIVAAGFVFTWIFSGWLSMDHGRIFSTGEMSDAEDSAFTGISPLQASKSVTRDMLRRMLPASELEVTALAGKAYIVARGAGSGPKVLEVGSSAAPSSAFPDAAIWTAVQAAWPGSKVDAPTLIPLDDIYARLRSTDGIGGDGVRVVVHDSSNSDVYVNNITGKVIEVMDTSRRVYRWLYFGLHTLDFPFLSNNVIWKPLMLILLMLGFAFSVTGVTIGWKRLVRKLSFRRA
ncbi:peptidase propeptide and YPEB domain protein [Paraburkholderia xenovorans LB400]|uniref:Membrane protein n=1 Tax=Paraburkholderia xenovorans (strain LB400) TaxID=266265 RepID=Q13J71_PARXL|nr:PepSY domain-containing protein [Paraburkholderia xenovorans]ABE35868.1 putative membrane protein [Paraburkholderia xenovorans LB400]AIP35224.1 peptidase propeptide and YPEB domain protein [Paraburkholderia xenovorans LB400]